MDLSFSVTNTATEAGTSSTVAVSGEVDVSNASRLREAVDERLADHVAELVVDLSEVSYIDSTGIGVLVGTAHRAEEQKVRFEVARPQKNVARVLGLLGVSEELHLKE